MHRVAIGPADRLRRFVVAMEVSTNLASEVGDRRENAARQPVSLDRRKLEFDLIEPRHTGRSHRRPLDDPAMSRINTTWDELDRDPDMQSDCFLLTSKRSIRHTGPAHFWWQKE